MAQPGAKGRWIATLDVGQGSGLGLDIAYKIVVARNKGDIQLISTFDDTRFRVRLTLMLENK